MFVLSAGLIDYKSSFNNLVLIRHGFRHSSASSLSSRALARPHARTITHTCIYRLTVIY